MLLDIMREMGSNFDPYADNSYDAEETVGPQDPKVIDVAGVIDAADFSAPAKELDRAVFRTACTLMATTWLRLLPFCDSIKCLRKVPSAPDK